MAFIQHIVHFDMAYHPQRAAQRLPGMHRLAGRTYPVEVSPFAGHLPCAVLPPPAADQCRTHFAELRRLDGIAGPAADCRRQAALLTLVALVLEHEDGQRPMPAARPSRSWRSLHRAVECILARLDDPDLDLAAIARASGVVPAYLPQLFRSQLGISVRRYLLQVRVRRAKELLAAGESVTAVAEATGFRGIHAFSRAFRRVVGVPPSAASGDTNGDPSGDSVGEGADLHLG
jgi:AraC-like DNA-binding protein